MTDLTTKKPSTEARFWDKVADRYAQKPIADEDSYRTKLWLTQTNFAPEMKILEFGCGTGSTALEHAPHVRHVLATDISGRMIEIARAKQRSAGIDNVTFSQTSIANLEAPDGSFDAILGLNVLHLVKNRDGVIEKVHRMLAPGGLFVTSTACLADTMAWFGLVAPVGRLAGLVPHVEMIKARELERDIEARGFKIDHRWKPDKGVSLFLIARRTR